ncbi:zinc metalloproteinase nas-14-like isoform X1 [Homalodisca vitripennis]|uniref:zinc metalloproteinase nas-14-like isoform X1 n=1 Tax=Homalodisca vitripennis TaxID=197043 RepID=UPI001EEC2A31|nr:zinc metalloproteinase nas-14-like isoform X1 [Homalodisca vitripennis]
MRICSIWVIGIFINIIGSYNALFLSNFSNIWPGSTVYYNAAPELPQSWIKAIKYGITYINALHCVYWVQRQPTDKYVNDYVSFQYNYIPFEDMSGCEAWVGHHGGQQPLVLGTKCMNKSVQVQRTAVLHEMMHTMGFEHEHQRYNRYCYVNVSDAVVRVDPASYNILPPPAYFTDWPYDYESIMHYHELDKLVWPYNPNQKMGRDDAQLSQYDLEKLQYLYCGGPSFCSKYGKAKCREVKAAEKKNPHCKTVLPKG